MKITNADTVLFQNAFDSGTSINNSATFSIEAAVNEMSLEELQKLYKYLTDKSGKTTNRVKMHNMYTFFKPYIVLNEVLLKVTTSLEAFKGLIQDDIHESFTNDNGEIQFEGFKEMVSNLIAVAKSRSGMME
jgi:hypothetical protein